MKKYFVWIIISVLMLSGCATFGLSGEYGKNLCADSRMGIAMAKVALPLATNTADREYWLKWLAAAEASMEIACQTTVK
jgi:hypothetical protein